MKKSELRQMIREELLNEAVLSETKISVKGANTPNWYEFHTVDATSLSLAYEASLVIIKMLEITISGKERGLERHGMKNYEEIEIKSHKELLSKIKKLADSKGIKINAKPPTGKFISLEDRLGAITNIAGKKKLFSSNIDDYDTEF